MIELCFPKCKVEGSVEPVRFVHMGSEGAIPTKCFECKFNLEGGCTRSIEKVGKYLQLDYGPCPVEGDTTPTESEYIVGDHLALVPQKCTSCNYISQWGSKVVCSYNKAVYGEYPRGLDWGNYVPPHEHIYT